MSVFVKPLAVVYSLSDVMNAVSAKLDRDTAKLSGMPIKGHELTRPALEASVKVDQMDLTVLALWQRQGIQSISAEQQFSDEWSGAHPLSPPQNTLHEQLRRNAVRLVR